ncbi:quinon protein alcohol dehydrogenase-like superfamily [Mycena pura]|uniref:Quinon protein alcohol dehydrogenase-like superfamily n=1 Tax=Mycena pura TaxID=153505 RepID=A0AAD6VIR6_9AGAR|nr:quinon protein alcohol dehydrogenase-like superfamily [Mycena pura]
MHSGFCFATFTEHTAPISVVAFAKHGSVLFSASLDGIVRAYNPLAVDPSGEVVAAGSTDSFEVFLWSVQTGKLLDVLTGHEGPQRARIFPGWRARTRQRVVGPHPPGVKRVWALPRSGAPLALSSDVLAVAFRPDGKDLVVATLDGQITFFDVGEADERHRREKRFRGTQAACRLRTASPVRHTTAWRTQRMAGGNIEYVVLYDDGTEEFLDSRKVNEAGINTLEPDRHSRRRETSTGLTRHVDPAVSEARTKCVRFSPTGRAWAAASTEGLLVYSPNTVTFDPFDLSIDLTPHAVLAGGEHLKALVGTRRRSSSGGSRKRARAQCRAAARGVAERQRERASAGWRRRGVESGGGAARRERPPAHTRMRRAVEAGASRTRRTLTGVRAVWWKAAVAVAEIKSEPAHAHKSVRRAVAAWRVEEDPAQAHRSMRRAAGRWRRRTEAAGAACRRRERRSEDAGGVQAARAMRRGRRGAGRWRGRPKGGAGVM